MELYKVSDNHIHKASDTQQILKTGDITKGRIVKLYPNQKALIQLGNQTIMVQLEAPLSAHTSYYFQVQQSSDDMIHLKVLHDDSIRTSPDNPRSLLHFLGLKTTKARTSLLDTLFKDRIPFGKTRLTKAFQLLDHAPNKEKAVTIAREMILRQYPLDEATFLALSAYKNNSFSAEAEGMLQMLSHEPRTPITDKLQAMLEKLLVTPRNTENKVFYALPPKEHFLQQINNLFMMGVGTARHNHETDMQEQVQTMKSLLIKLLHSSEGVVHDKAKSLFHFLNGLHLQSVFETARFLESTLLIPAEKLGLNGDIKLAFSGHKNESGEIDPEYCHILFYLDLATIQETVIDMRIQKRRVTLTVLNEHFSALKKTSETLKDKLKDGLKELDYELQSIRFKAYQHQENHKTTKNFGVHFSSHQGVDYRI